MLAEVNFTHLTRSATWFMNAATNCGSGMPCFPFSSEIGSSDVISIIGAKFSDFWTTYKIEIIGIILRRKRLISEPLNQKAEGIRCGFRNEF